MLYIFLSSFINPSNYKSKHIIKMWSLMFEISTLLGNFRSELVEFVNIETNTSTMAMWKNSITFNRYYQTHPIVACASAVRSRRLSIGHLIFPIFRCCPPIRWTMIGTMRIAASSTCDSFAVALRLHSSDSKTWIRNSRDRRHPYYAGMRR